jgi:hypothetical protein
MNLQPVTGKPFQKMCALCFHNFLFGQSTDRAEHPEGGFADLDGKPFAAYYCNKCAAQMQEMRNRANDVTMRTMDILVAQENGNTSWDVYEKFKHSDYTLWVRIVDGERLFVTMRNGITPSESCDGGYYSRETALRQKGLL